MRCENCGVDGGVKNTAIIEISEEGTVLGELNQGTFCTECHVFQEIGGDSRGD